MGRSRNPKAKLVANKRPANELPASLRASDNDAKLPQGCTPAEKRAALEALANLRGVQPIADPATMAADFWPAEESVDEMVNAIRALRRESE